MNHLFDLCGRTAVVTGALGRLGPLWSAALLEAGARVAALDRPEAQGSVTLERLVRQHGDDRLRLFRADIRDRGALEEACAQAIEAFGTPHVLVNNAGIDQAPDVVATFRIEEVPFDSFREVLDVNIGGTFQVTQVFGREMVRAGRGSIINIASLYAAVSPDARFYSHLATDPPFLKPPAYGASKAALVNLTKYLAAHWAPFGVRVNALSPGGVLGDQDEEFTRKFSERVPMGRLAEASDLVGPLLFLASDASSYVTGIDLRVDGGYTAW